MTLVLASASPARLTLLRSAGLHPRVIVSEIDEDALVASIEEQRHMTLDAPTTALVLARAKAVEVAARTPGKLVVGCDSVLEFAGETYGKPSSPAEAIDRWRSMRGHSGVLHTGHCLIDTRPFPQSPIPYDQLKVSSVVASTTVSFAEIDDTEIEGYVATGEPLRVAGAFTLDGLGAPYIERIEGDPGTVIGLSLPTLRCMLAEVGIRLSHLRAPTLGA